MMSNPIHEYLPDAMAVDLEAAKRRGRGAEFLANHFHMSAAWVYKCVSGERPFPLHRIGEWARVTGSEQAARWVARELGLAYVPIPSGNRHILTQLTELVEANAASTIEAMQIYADGTVDEAEAADKVPHCIETLRSAINVELALIAKLEADAAMASAKPKTLKEFEQMGAAK